MPGGSGFLGRSAAEFFRRKNYEVIILSRGQDKIEDDVKFVNWDAETLGDWTRYLENAFAVINFTGKSVNCLYTEENKREIINSRVDSVRILTDAILQAENPPKVFVQAASLAIYGDTTKVSDENASPGEGFSVEVCKLWEAEFFKCELPATRKVLFRIGFVLEKNGGALESLEKITKFYLGGTIGSGKQYISWLHIKDLNRMFDFALENETAQGIYNATSVNPATNAEFMKTLRDAMGMPWSPPVPAFAVKIGANLIMRADPSLALTGRNCVPKKLLDENFQFEYTDLKQTLEQIINSK